jgi:Probable Zinc-ribbon domain
MKSLKKHSSLFEIAPNLVKEWHPSANDNLTPRNVNIGYAKKVWWLCREGHEWLATIKCRMKRNDCHICEKEETKKKADVSISIPTIGKNYRNNRRFKTKGTAVIEVPNSGHWIYAEMTDFCSHGLNFETEVAIQPGTVIIIKFDKALVSSRLDKSPKSSFNDGYKTYNSTVKWCKKLDEDQTISTFGIGVELS